MELTEDDVRRIIGEVLDERYCCKRLPARHPSNHNEQVRTQGRCFCTCHKNF